MQPVETAGPQHMTATTAHHSIVSHSSACMFVLTGTLGMLIYAGIMHLSQYPAAWDKLLLCLVTLQGFHAGVQHTSPVAAT